MAARSRRPRRPRPLHQLLEALARDTDSTMMVAGSDAYAAALVLYNNVKFLARNNQPGAQAAYNDLAQRFPGNGGGWQKPGSGRSTSETGPFFVEAGPPKGGLGLRKAALAFASPP